MINSIYVRGEIPLKFQYIGDGAKYWSRLSESRKGDENFEGFEIKETGDEIIRRTKKGESIYLIDLGCGNGDPAEVIIRRLMENEVNVEYVPVDISPELLEMTTKKIKALGVKVKPILMDFDRDSLINVFSELDDRPAHILLLGNTLGNHSNELKILVNIRDAMRIHDVLYLGLYMYSPYKIGSIAESYYDENVQKLVKNVPEHVLKIDPSALEMNVQLYEIGGKRQILGFLRINEDYNTNIAGYHLEILSGDRIMVFRSVRYTPAQIAKLAEDAEMRFIHFAENEYGTVSVSALAPKRIG